MRPPRKEQTSLDVIHSAIGELDPMGDSEDVSKSMYIVSVAKERCFSSVKKLLVSANKEYRKDTGHNFEDSFEEVNQ